MAERDQPHSAEAFGPLRDFWWNVDHLKLCAHRVGFDGARSVLDVGSGIGHWGRLLAQVLPADSTVVGVDPEPAWVEEAGRRAADAGLGDRFSYTLGSVESLPFGDASFDLVTCQTVLIHVADPRVAIREMLRVTKPGGVVLATEPNNRSIFLMDTSVSAGATVEERIDLLRFHLTVEQGKLALGEGNSSIGELVPRYFADEGLEAIQIYLCDKAWLMMPPYADDEAQALEGAYGEEAERGSWSASRETTRRYYVAGGGSDLSFDTAWERRLSENRQVIAAIEAGSFSSAGGRIVYLVAGRRPG
jgi:SAM-dependent methyltransferase